MREVLNLPVTDDSYRICNSRLVIRAREHGRIHLIAFWDGRSGDDPGGTADMVAHADPASKPDIFSPESLNTGR
jgi:hypothetical protein